MNVLVEHYVRLSNGNTKYENGRPVTTTTVLKLPIKFGYDHFSKPMVVLNHNIQVEDIVKITQVD
jgi:hypothetical protein